MATVNLNNDSLGYLPITCLSHTVPAATVEWVAVEPNDHRRIPACVAVLDQGSTNSGLGLSSSSSSPSSPNDAKIVFREPEVEKCEDLMVGRAFNTGSNYVYEESPFTLIPGTVIHGRMITIGSGGDTFDYDSFEMLTVPIHSRGIGPMNDIGRNANPVNVQERYALTASAVGTGITTTSVNTGVHWRKCQGGAVPKYAIKGGVSQGGDMLYIGRNAACLTTGRDYEGRPFPLRIPPERFVGRVFPRLEKLLVAFRGTEYSYGEYEVLTLNQSPASLQVLCRNLIVSQCSTASSNGTVLRGPKSLPKHPPAKMLSLPLPPKMIRFLERLWPVERRQRRRAENANTTTMTTSCEGETDEFPDELGYMDQLINMQPITQQTLRTLYPSRINWSASNSDTDGEDADGDEDDDDGGVRSYDDVRCSDSDISDDDDDSREVGGAVDGWNSQLFPDILS